jgi:esterase/lipase
MNPQDTTVVLIPGFGEYPETLTFQSLKIELEEQGYKVVIISWPHYPDDLSKYSFTETINSAQAIIKNIQESGRKVILQGNSMGGILAIYLAKEVSPVKLVLTVTPYQAGTEDDLAGKYKDWKETGIREFTSSKYGILKIPFSFIEDARKYNALEIIADIDCPVLFVTGENDKNVPWATTRKLYEAATNKNNEWHLLTGMEHKFQYQPERLKDVNDLILKFVK